MPDVIDNRGINAVPEVGLFKRWWVTDHFHAVLWLVVMIFMLLLYIVAHNALHGPYVRSNAVNNALSSAVLLYQVQADATTGALELVLEGRVVDPADQESGPLGIGKLAAARGLLAQSKAVLDDFNRRLGSHVDFIKSAFRPAPSSDDALDIPLRLVNDDLSVFGTESGTLVARVPRAQFDTFTERTVNQDTAGQLIRLLNGSSVFNVSRPDTAVEDFEIKDINSARPLSTNVREARDRIEANVRDQVLQLSSSRVATPAGFQVGHAVCEEIRSIAAPVRGLFGDSTAACAEAQEATGCNFRSALGIRRCKVADNVPTSAFHFKLKEIAQSEVSYFWTIGPYLWVEVVLLVWLGVLTEALVRLGVQYAGRDPDEAVWEPRETVRTLFKLGYAPALAIVVIWLLMMTDIIESETRLAESGQTAIVPLAYVLGLFPNLGYALLKRFAEAVFRDTTIARRRKKPKSATVYEAGTNPVPAGTAPDFSAVRDRIKRHAMAPLRTGG